MVCRDEYEQRPKFENIFTLIVLPIGTERTPRIGGHDGFLQQQGRDGA